MKLKLKKWKNIVEKIYNEKQEMIYENYFGIEILVEKY